jgi:NADH dehydrogenase
VVSCVEREETVGHAYDLGGPEYWTYREMVAEVITAMGRKRAILTMPLPLIKAVARSSEVLRLPFPVATDQLRQLAFDNAAGLGDVERDFSFAPRSMHGSLGYLRQGRKQQEPIRSPAAATA